MALGLTQVAIAVQDIGETIHRLSLFGWDEWTTDIVEAKGKLFGTPIKNRAQLAFNYQVLPGIELELIKYLDGPNWHAAQGIIRKPFLSHLGVHVDDLAPYRLKRLKLAQDVLTTSHTNPDIQHTRRYRYLVLDTRDVFGFDLKLIQRVPIAR